MDLGATAAMRFLLRFIGLVLLAGAFASAVVDGARLLADGAWAPTSTGAALDWLSPKGLAAAETFVDSRFGAWVWNGLLGKALIAPAFAALTVVSALLFLVSSPPRPDVVPSRRKR